jgi:Flp pilus assembly pilin Flp
MHKRRGQTILEYTIILVIILGVLVTMKDYIKRGFSGRWKSATDDFGDQYDPQYVNSNIMYGTQVNSVSTVAVANDVVNGVPGQWTTRVDTSTAEETKTGQTQIGN